MPFPREETTPPVTKMYLVAFGPVVMRLTPEMRANGLPPVEGPPGVDARQGRLGQRGHADADAMVQRAELFQPLGQLGRAGRQPPPSAPARRGCRRTRRGAGSRGRRPGRADRAGSGSRRARSTAPGPAASVTTLTRAGSPASAGSSGAAAVPTSSPAPPAPRRPASASRVRKGSSPWTFTTTSNAANSGRAPPRPPGRCRLGCCVGQHGADPGPLHDLRRSWANRSRPRDRR